jgi:transposase
MTTSNHPEWALKHKKKGTELRKIRGRYYLYEVTSKYDKERKRAKKITGKCLGSITKDGFKPSKRNIVQNISDARISVKSYAGCLYFKNEAKKWVSQLKKSFPDIWKQIYSMSYIRLFHQSPIKRMPFYFSNTFLSEEFKDLSFSDKTLGKLLNKIGQQQSSIDSFLKHFVENSNAALIDATSVFTQTKNMYEARLGYNNKRQWYPQLNLLYLYDYKLIMPLYHRILQGDLREISAFKLTLEQSGLKDAIIIGDKGFSSEKNIEAIRDSQLRYILPLRRNSARIDYSGLKTGTKLDMDGYFRYKSRYIWFKNIAVEQDSLTLFLDEDLRVNEEKDYLDRINKYPEDYSQKSFFDRQIRMGALALMTNIDDFGAEALFQTYKSRCEVEQQFDVYKDFLKADRLYVHSTESVKGWLFINHIALIVYYSIFRSLKQKKLLSKISVEDVIEHLAHINKVKIKDKWILQEIPKKTDKLISSLGLVLHIT